MLVFRTNEGPGNVALLVPFALNVLEPIAGHIDLVIDIASVEPTIWRPRLEAIQEIDIPKSQVLLIIGVPQRRKFGELYS